MPVHNFSPKQGIYFCNIVVILELLKSLSIINYAITEMNILVPDVKSLLPLGILFMFRLIFTMNLNKKI